MRAGNAESTIKDASGWSWRSLVAIGLAMIVCVVLSTRTNPWDDINVAREHVASKTIVIAGASSGIGEQMAYHFAKYDVNLVLSARVSSFSFPTRIRFDHHT